MISAEIKASIIEEYKKETGATTIPETGFHGLENWLMDKYVTHTTLIYTISQRLDDVLKYIKALTQIGE